MSMTDIKMAKAVVAITTNTEGSAADAGGPRGVGVSGVVVPSVSVLAASMADAKVSGKSDVSFKQHESKVPLGYGQIALGTPVSGQSGCAVESAKSFSLTEDKN